MKLGMCYSILLQGNQVFAFREGYRKGCNVACGTRKSVRTDLEKLGLSTHRLVKQ